MFSALVPSQGEKVVNYPTRPVDTTTDFEGTTSRQPAQPVSHYIYLYTFGQILTIGKNTERIMERHIDKLH